MNDNEIKRQWTGENCFACRWPAAYGRSSCLLSKTGGQSTKRFRRSADGGVETAGIAHRRRIMTAPGFFPGKHHVEIDERLRHNFGRA